MRKRWWIAGLVAVSLAAGVLVVWSRRQGEPSSQLYGPRLEHEVANADYIVMLKPDAITYLGATPTPWDELASEYLVNLTDADVARVARNPDVPPLSGEITVLRTGDRINTFDKLATSADEVVLLLDHLVVRKVTLSSMLRVVDGALLGGDWKDAAGELRAFENARSELGLSILEALARYGRALDRIDGCDAGDFDVGDDMASVLIRLVRDTNATCVAEASRRSSTE